MQEVSSDATSQRAKQHPEVDPGAALPRGLEDVTYQSLGTATQVNDLSKSSLIAKCSPRPQSALVRAAAHNHIEGSFPFENTPYIPSELRQQTNQALTFIKPATEGYGGELLKSGWVDIAPDLFFSFCDAINIQFFKFLRSILHVCRISTCRNRRWRYRLLKN